MLNLAYNEKVGLSILCQITSQGRVIHSRWRFFRDRSSPESFLPIG